MNIPPSGNRESGKMETAIPANRKPQFRRIGNRNFGESETGVPVKWKLVTTISIM